MTQSDFSDPQAPIPDEPDVITWRVHLRSAPETVHRALSTPEGRERFWAPEAPERGGMIHFRFRDDTRITSRILVNDPPGMFALTYFSGSRVVFNLEREDQGGTLLTVEERGFDPESRADQHAGWVSWLLTLKAAVDFDVDLRNPDPTHSWSAGFVDV